MQKKRPIDPSIPGNKTSGIRIDKRTNCALSLVEILISIAVVGIIATLLIPYVSSTKRSANEAVGRQQQAELQAALGSWIVAQSSGPGGLASTRALYNGASGPKLQLLRNYLQQDTYSSLQGEGNNVTSAALDSVNARLQFSDWLAEGQPAVQWISQ
jgi:type II secretory pathway pseudopilin PulG